MNAHTAALLRVCDQLASAQTFIKSLADASVATTPAHPTGPASASPEPPPPLPVDCDFFDFNKPPVVNGKKKAMLTQREYDVLTALAEAGPRGLNKDDLDKNSGHSEARKCLKKLAEDPDWNSVIIFPQSKGRGGYRLRFN